MSLTSLDIEQLETFKKCLGLSNKIGWKSSGSVKQKKYGHVQFGNVGMYRWFISIGITPRKSKTIGVIAIPDEYFLDFLRGSFDGDGSSHAYWDLRWRSSVCLYITFTSASYKHLVWLNQTIQRLIGIETVINIGKDAYGLRFSKHKAAIVYKAMYYSDTIPYLQRKKEKLERQWAVAELAGKGERPVGVTENKSSLRIP